MRRLKKGTDGTGAGDADDIIEPEVAKLSWLIQALDSAHGSTYPKTEFNDLPVGASSDLTAMVEEYIRASWAQFPTTALEQQESVVRACVANGFSPRDIVRVYTGSLMNVREHVEKDPSGTKLFLFLACILARILEEYQMMIMTAPSK